MNLRSSLKLPKEHGAWAMLYVPFVLGVAVAGTVSWAVLLLLLATTALFISRESLLVWWRARKRGRQSQSAMDSQRLLLIYVSVAALTGLPLVLVYKFYWLMLFGMLGWGDYSGEMEELTPYFPSSGSGQINVEFHLAK